MKFVLFLTVFVSNYSIANDLMALFPPPPKESSPGTFEYDHNQDAIIDRVVKKMGQTQTELLDRNQNKFFETKVISNAQNLFFQEIYTSTKDNGIYDQRKTFRSIKADQIEIATAILKNNKYEIISTDIETNSQEQSCPSPNDLMKKLSTKITDLKSLYQGTNIMTPYGVMLTKGCLDRYGAEGLNKTLQSGLEKGLSCLNSLAKNYYAQKTLPIPLVSHNLSKISEIMQQKTNPVKLICDNNQDPDRWKRAAAFASTGPTSEKILNQYAHPYICLSPLYRDKSQGPLKNKEEEFIDTLELQKTVFHELLHTLGYRHYQDIEFSYTCEECCFGDQIDYDSPNCRICTGGYDGVNDEKYFDDLMLLENVTSSSDTSSTRYLFNHISKSSNSRYLTFSLFNLSKKYASFHQALYEIYDRKFSVKSPYEIHQLDLIKQRKLPAASEDQKNLIRALLSYYIDHDPLNASAALSRIKNNSALLADKSLKKIAYSLTYDMIFDEKVKMSPEQKIKFNQFYDEIRAK